MPKLKSRKPHEPVAVQVPKNLDIDRHIPPSRTDVANRLKDGCYYFLSCITEGVFDKRTVDKSDGGYVNLSSVYLKSIIGDKMLEKVKGVLLNSGIVETDEVYVKGEKSYGYRLAQQFYNDLEYKEITDLNIRKRIKARREKLSKEQEKLMCPPLKKLTNYFEDGGLSIDLDQAHGLLEHWRANIMRKIESSTDSKLPAERLDNLSRFIISHKQQIKRISEAMMYGPGCVRDGTGWRLHTPLTGIKKEFRHFLSYKGQELVGTDIKSSQPYFLSALLSELFWKNKIPIGFLNISDIYPQLGTQANRLHKLSTIIKSVNSPESPDSKGLYGVNYLQIPWEDDYYQYFLQKSAPYLDQPYVSRDKVKKDHMTMLFNVRCSEVWNNGKAYSVLFPQVWQLIKFIRGLKVRGESQTNNLAVLLQRIESKCLLEYVVPAIQKDHPKMPLFTIHDSILTTKGNEKIVQEYMERVLTKLIGTKPGLKTEYYNLEEAKKLFPKMIDEGYNKTNKSVKSLKHRPSIPFSWPAPLLYTIPIFDGKQIFSTRYVDHDSLWVGEA